MIKALKGFVLKNDGPWGPINDDKNKKPKNNSGNNIDKDLDEVIKKGQDILKNFLNNSGNSGGSNNNKKASDGKTPPIKSIFGIVVLAIIVLWLSTGIYKVNSDENAIVLYFGKFHSVTHPGLNYRIPAPFSKLIKKSVQKVNNEKFETSVSYNNDNNLMLTGDENIVDIDFEIQWQIGNIKDYVFNITDTHLALKKSAESAMREIIAKTPIADALSDGKQKIQASVMALLQEILDLYGSGISITSVQLLRVDPPKQVIDSFRDVQTAKADKEKEINQAQAYRNDVIPRARGEAEKLTQSAEAYKQQVISDAIGQTKRFLAVYNEYRKAKGVTKRRIYLETMEKIYADMDKIIIDNKLSKSGIVPYLPLNELKKKND